MMWAITPLTFQHLLVTAPNLYNSTMTKPIALWVALVQATVWDCLVLAETDCKKRFDCKQKEDSGF